MSIERRIAPRRNASGQVKLRPYGFASAAISSQIVDISSSGFRVRHNSQTLASGHIVDFTYGRIKGRARVVWTRIVGTSAESGFLILPRTQD